MKINDPVQSWSRLFHAAADIVVESERNARVWKNSFFLIALMYLVNAKVIRCVKKVPSTIVLSY